jgi:hypothetical protein
VKTTSTLLLLALSCPVFAVTVNTGGSIVVNQGLFTLVSQSVTFNFNDGLLPSANGITYTGATTNVVTGNISGVTATPPNDTSAYLTIGPTRGASVTITSAYALDYLGFYVGSLDSYNFIDLYMGNKLVAALTGTQIASIGGFSANGDQGRGIYVNIYASSSAEHFDRIVMRSTSNALESDNHAFRAVNRISTTVVDSPVPEPASALLLIPALVWMARKRASR